MTDFLQQLIIGLRLGSVYALVALGYTMVYGIIRLINFAHGDFIMVGGYTLYFTVPILLHSMGLPAWTGVIAAIVICALVGVLVELVAYRPVRRKGTSMSALITAIAMSLLLENLAQAIPAMGPNPRVISDEIFSTAPMSLGGVSVNMAAVITIVIAAVVMAALQVFVQKTKLGRAMRAVSENKEASTLVGIPALRLHGDYLAIVTLGFGLIVENVIANLPFAGGEGLANGTASSSLYANGLGLSTSLQAKYVWLVLGITILCIALMCMFIRSKYGRAIEAIRDDEIAASASGVNTTYYKILTFVISAFFAGLAGGLYATCFSSLTTASFTFTSASIWNSTFIVVIVVLGGMGSMTGSVLAAIAMYLLNYEIKNGAWVSALPGFVQTLFQFPMLIYALVLLVIIIFRPRGILGTYEFSLDRLLFDGRLAEKRKAKARKGGADA